MHLIRKKISVACPVCAADAFVPCIGTEEHEAVQLQFDFSDSDAEIGYLEYMILGAVHRLRELKPSHVLVQTVAAVIRYQEGETPQH